MNTGERLKATAARTALACGAPPRLCTGGQFTRAIQGFGEGVVGEGPALAAHRLGLPLTPRPLHLAPLPPTHINGEAIGEERPRSRQ